MKRILFAGLFAAFLAIPAGIATADEDIAAIKAAGAKLVESFANGDAAAVAALYTADASLLPAGSPRVDGREAIQAYWQASMDAGVGDFVLNTTEIEDEDDMAFETGTYSLTVPMEDGSRATVTGQYVVVWEEDDDVWLLHRDIWNIDAAQ